jgi:hypothetical protein
VKIRLRHITYGAFVAVVVIPFFLLAVAARLFEQADELCGRMRRWAYQEKYAPRLPRKPGWQ